MQLSLLHPQWLWAIPVLGVGLLFLKVHHKKRGAQFSRWRWIFYPLGMALCFLALARPQLGKNVSQRRGSGGQYFLAVDISRSMLAQDVQPSRLRFAKTAVQYLAPFLQGSQLALYPFAADGYLQIPLTRDIDSILSTLGALSPSMTTDQGTDLSQALDTLYAQILKMENEALSRGDDWPPTQVILFSDGESHHELNRDVLVKYHKKKIPVFTVGTATKEGGRIPLSFDHAMTTFQSGTYLRDSSGKMVETHLDADRLAKISEATGGQYFPAQLSEMKKLSNRLQQNQSSTSISTQVEVEAEYYPLLLSIALALLILDFCLQRWEFAIRALFPIAILLMGAKAADSPEQIQAQIQKTEDNESRAILTHNLGVQLSKRNDLEKAAEAFQEASYLSEDPSVRKKTLFNLGNTLLQMQKIPEALEAYQHAYDTHADDKQFDASTNKKISENMALAANILAQAQPQGGEGEGDGNSPPQDPKGPKKDYKAEKFSKARKQKIFDLMANEEQQAMQRLQRARENKRPVSPQAKTW